MKFILLLLLSFQIQAQVFPTTVQRNPQWVIDNILKDLPDEIFLKERLKLEDPQIIKGEVRGHKVGNGFSIPHGDQSFEIDLICPLPEGREFLILKNKKDQLMALLTAERQGENLAEFLEVKEVERTVIFESFRYMVGTNPLRGEMFQLQWMPNQMVFLRIVYEEQLHHFSTTCRK